MSALLRLGNLQCHDYNKNYEVKPMLSVCWKQNKTKNDDLSC